VGWVKLPQQPEPVKTAALKTDSLKSFAPKKGR
jgi:hypothetical protein